MPLIVIAGVTFHQDAVKALVVDQPLYMRREPQNKYDPNAIRVETADGMQIGYIPKKLSTVMAPLIDETGQYPVLKVQEFTRFQIERKFFTGVTVLLTSPVPEEVE